MITIKDQRSKIQDYISLYVTEINDLHCMHYILHVISCIISPHFMSHFTSFHVIFHTFHCTYHTHRTHITHVAHYAFREQRAFHALHHTSRHFISFFHEISYHTHSYHLGVKRVENGSKRHTLQLSATWVGHSIQEDKNATWVRHFSNDKNAASSRRFISLVQFRPRVPFLTKTSSCISQNSYLRVVQMLLRYPKLLEES